MNFFFFLIRTYWAYEKAKKQEKQKVKFIWAKTDQLINCSWFSINTPCTLLWVLIVNFPHNKKNGGKNLPKESIYVRDYH